MVDIRFTDDAPIATQQPPNSYATLAPSYIYNRKLQFEWIKKDRQYMCEELDYQIRYLIIQAR